MRGAKTRFSFRFVLSLLETHFLVVAFFGILFSSQAFAYPNYVAYGYPSCGVCHYNPMGNGPLTDYGRALSASTLSDKLFLGQKTDDELAEASGFLFGEDKLPTWLRPSFDFRGMVLVRNLQSSPSTWMIPMQLDGNLVLKFLEDRLFFSGTLGYVPPPSTLTPAEQAVTPVLISREHYAGYKLNKEISLLMGHMDPVFGLKTADHNAYIRSQLLLDQNDQTHGLVLHSASPNQEGAFHLMAGNLYQSAGVQLRGVSGLYEWQVDEKLRIGGSGAVRWNQFRAHQMFAVHAKWRMGAEGENGFVGEFALIRDAPYTTTTPITMGQAFYAQFLHRLSRGLHFLPTLEYYSSAWEGATRFIRLGPGLLYSPFHRIELRVDFQVLQSIGISGSSPASANLLAQTHVYL